MPEPFRVGLTRDFLSPTARSPSATSGSGCSTRRRGVELGVPRRGRGRAQARRASRGYDALLVLAPPRSPPRPSPGPTGWRSLARFGVGYDSVDVDACTDRGVLLTITPDGVRRPVAAAAMTLLLALAHRLLLKDRLTREGRWAEKLEPHGPGLSRAARSGSSGSATSAARSRCSRAVRDARLWPSIRTPTPEQTAAARASSWSTSRRCCDRSDFVCVTCAADPGDAPPDQRRAAGADEAHRLPDQHRPRADRRPARPVRGAPGRAHRRGRAGRLRAGAGRPGRPDPDAGQRHRVARTRSAGPTSASLGIGRSACAEHPRRRRRPRAPPRRQPRGARPPALREKLRRYGARSEGGETDEGEHGQAHARRAAASSLGTMVFEFATAPASPASRPQAGAEFA